MRQIRADASAVAPRPRRLLHHEGVEQTEQGSFVVGTEEMRVLRQGLFVTLHQGDAEIQHNLQTITGYDLDEFRQLMWEIDELNGHNDEVRRLLGSQLQELAELTTPELEKCSQRLREVVAAADIYGLEVPPSLHAAATRWND